MLFNSWEFLALLVPTFLLYYAFPRNAWQAGVAIAASFIFYASYEPWLLLLLVSSIAINALASFGAIYGSTPGRQKAAAVSGVVVNLALLAAFKYNALLYKSFVVDSSAEDPVLKFLLTIPLPIGISFFTFQGISLVVDAYRDRSAHGRDLNLQGNFWRHLAEVAFFKSFFPQLVAGPIVKAHDFFPQLRVKYLRDIPWTSAMKALILGYFLKMVVADNLKDQTFWLTFPHFQANSTLTLLVLLLGYSMQIFADFAGYSLIAIGLARLFGYEFPRNFHFPYIAQSFSEFWTRWHISLSSWLRDYLYLPLGGNRRGAIITYRNLMLVMFLGGLWHGATWSYAIWGSWHGLLLAMERLLGLNKTAQRAPAWLRALRIAFVFTAVTFAWLLFKLPNFDHVLIYLRCLWNNGELPHQKRLIFNVALYSLPVFFYHGYYLLRPNDGHAVEPGSQRIRGEAAIYGVLLFCILFNSGAPGAFIYFQF